MAAATWRRGLTAEDDLYSQDEKYFDYRDRLHLISAPTLVVVGDKDWICPLGAWAT